MLLVASNPGLIFSEVPLLRTARAPRRAARMAIDPSWDNFTNKLIPVRQVDRLIVWNELMKQQAIELHGYEPTRFASPARRSGIRYFRTARDAARRVLPRASAPTRRAS